VGARLDAVYENGFGLRVRNSRFPAWLHSGALAAALLLVASCHPEDYNGQIEIILETEEQILK